MKHDSFMTAFELHTTCAPIQTTGVMIMRRAPALCYTSLFVEHAFSVVPRFEYQGEDYEARCCLVLHVIS